jgi:hypothetical protein
MGRARNCAGRVASLGGRLPQARAASGGETAPDGGMRLAENGARRDHAKRELCRAKGLR